MTGQIADQSAECKVNRAGRLLEGTSNFLGNSWVKSGWSRRRRSKRPNPPQRGTLEGHVDDSLTRGYCPAVCSAPGASKKTRPKLASATHVELVSRSPVRRAATVIRLEAGSVTAVGLL